MVLNWGRRYSLWVFNFGLACCAIEFIAASMARHDFIRLGVIPFAPGPRQADLMVVSGTVTDKMAPAIRRLYDQMPEPKYVISFGACSNCGGPYWDSYCVTKGVDQLIPVDVYVPGCPPRPEALLQGILRLQEKIAAENLTQQGPAGAVCRVAPRRRGRGHPPAGVAAGTRTGGDVSAAASREVAPAEWGTALRAARDEGFDFFDWLSAVDQMDDAEAPGFDVVCHLIDTGSTGTGALRRVLLRTRVARGAGRAEHHRPVGRRGLARAGDARDVRHRLRRFRGRHRAGAAPAAAARGVRGHAAAQVVRPRRAGEQGVAGGQGAGGGRRGAGGGRASGAPRPRRRATEPAQGRSSRCARPVVGAAMTARATPR